MYCKSLNRVKLGQTGDGDIVITVLCKYKYLKSLIAFINDTIMF